MVHLLVEFGCKLNLATPSGKTPLMIAARNGHCELVRFLIQAGAKLNCVDTAEKCALIHAAEGGHLNVVAYMLSAEWPIPDQSELSMEEAAQQALVAASKHGHIDVSPQYTRFEFLCKNLPHTISVPK